MHEAKRKYCTDTTQCRRQQLMVQFSETGNVATPVFMHMCCDVCAEQCVCELCTVDVSLSGRRL